MTRLRTVSTKNPGWTRRRRGSGFTYLDERGERLPADAVERIRALAIPPAWRDVWVCPDELGHLQATGTDDAGRLQYLYHPEWRRKRDLAKHERVLAMAGRLPGVRRRVRASLPSAVPERDGVLDLAVRMIDLGCFRVGSDDYLDTNGSFGLTTLELRHVRRVDDGYAFAYQGKSGVDQEVVVDDAEVTAAMDRLTRRRDPHARLLSARDGRRWVPLLPQEVNARIRDLFDLEVTSKDFRTWHATVAVAEALADEEPADSRRGRARQVRAAMQEAADLLGNTVAVARSSYVDPRVVDLFENGTTIAPALRRAPDDPDRRRDAIDRAVVRLLR